MNKTDIFNTINNIFDSVDKVCNASVTSTNKLQFPVMLSKVGEELASLNFDAKQIKEAQPLIRFYIHNHDVFCSSRGRSGGVELKDNKAAREADKAAKDAIKAQLKDVIDSKMAAATTSPFPLDADEVEEDTETTEDIEEDITND